MNRSYWATRRSHGHGPSTPFLIFPASSGDRALLPSQHYYVALSDRDLHDPTQCGVARRAGRVAGEDLKALLNARIAAVLARKGAAAAASVSAIPAAASRRGGGWTPGGQLREALAHFDSARDGTMSAAELRKALQSMGVVVDDRSVQAIVRVRACPGPRCGLRIARDRSPSPSALP